MPYFKDRNCLLGKKGQKVVRPDISVDKVIAMQEKTEWINSKKITTNLKRYDEATCEWV